MKQVQDFYKATITQDWSIGTGIFYVSVKPTITEGWLYVSPNNPALREQIYYNGVGTDGNGDYIIVTQRGMGTTDEQTHTIGEPIRMNVGEGYIEYLTDAIEDIIAAGTPDADTSTAGKVEIATDAEVLAGTETGGTGAILAVTPKTLKDNVSSLSLAPVIRTYKSVQSARFGDNTTRINITTPSGTTRRYTWNGTGTNPNINATNFPIGQTVILGWFSSQNNGLFTITGSGNNYFEITNSVGINETNKEALIYVITEQYTWTKPTGLKYIEVEVQSAGGNGGSGGTDSNGGAGGTGGYSRKNILASILGETETITTRNSTFGLHAITTAGSDGSNGSGSTGGIGGAGGTASSGDLNISGVKGSDGFGSQYGEYAPPDGTNSLLGIGGRRAGDGGSATGFGASGAGGGPDRRSGGTGAPGIVIVTEYYI